MFVVISDFKVSLDLVVDFESYFTVDVNKTEVVLGQQFLVLLKQHYKVLIYLQYLILFVSVNVEPDFCFNTYFYNTISWCFIIFTTPCTY